jgi:hypothetical protein
MAQNWNPNCLPRRPQRVRRLASVATMQGSAPHRADARPRRCRVPCLIARHEHRATPECFVLPTARPPPLSPALERSSMATAAMDGHRGQSRLAPHGFTRRSQAKPSPAWKLPLRHVHAR